MKISEIMRRNPWTIGETDTIGNAQSMLMRNRIRHLPVVSEGKLVGVLTERDIFAARAHAGPEAPWWKTPVHDAMHAPAQTAGPDDSLTEIAGRMAASKIGCLPIVEQGKVIGLVTTTDVLDAEVREAMAPAPKPSAIAADIMTAWPRTIRPEAPLIDGVAVMVDHHVRHVPVVDSTSTIVGMLSERDVRTAVGDPTQYVEFRRRTEAQYRVRDVMTKSAVVIPFDRPIVEIAQLFADAKLGALPVIDRFGALIGIVSYVDVLRALAL